VAGATLTPSFATGGKIALVVFDGTSGQQVSLGIGGGVVSTTTTIYNPNGTVLGSVGTDFNGGSLHVSSLPVTGTYTIMVLPGPNTGNAPLTLSQDLNVGTIQINGASVNVTTTRQGQRARLTFSGTTGQRLTIGTVNATRQATYAVLNPDGSQLVSQGAVQRLVDGATTALDWHVYDPHRPRPRHPDERAGRAVLGDQRPHRHRGRRRPRHHR
jgi:hypothetical protein